MIADQVMEERPGGWNPLRSRLLDITGGDIYIPLLLLFLLWFFDEFDTAAFNVLAPDIKRHFALTDRSYLGIVVLNISILLLLSIPVGHYGDRVKRVVLVVI